MKTRISIIGSGYIGLVTGACLADMGNIVTCADIDIDKIQRLSNSDIPIYEPGLSEIVRLNLENKRLNFTTNVNNAINDSDIIFIAVNTPAAIDGSADISALKKVAKAIGQNLNENKIICIKSTVPIGTYKIVQEIIDENNIKKFKFDVVSIPEFLREGCAIQDFMNPDRIIIGTQSQDIFLKLKNIFLATKCEPKNIIQTTNIAAETIKYVSNSFLALKVSFINEIANFCDHMSVDIFDVVKGVGLDSRIGNKFLNPGPGFGGSCFPKDVLALKQMAENIKIQLKTIDATLQVNELQKKMVVQKLKQLMNSVSLSGKTIAVLGLAFKGNTDDIRKSPAIDIIQYLKNEEAIIKVYDPKAMENFAKEIPNLIYCESAYQAVQNSDAILILTDWKEFKELDFEKISKLIKSKNILDTRNILDINNLKKLGFNIDTIGRSIVAQSKQINYFNFQNKKINNKFTS